MVIIKVLSIPAEGVHSVEFENGHKGHKQKIVEEIQLDGSPGQCPKLLLGGLWLVTLPRPGLVADLELFKKFLKKPKKTNLESQSNCNTASSDTAQEAWAGTEGKVGLLHTRPA